MLTANVVPEHLRLGQHRLLASRPITSGRVRARGRQARLSSSRPTIQNSCHSPCSQGMLSVCMQYIPPAVAAVKMSLPREGSSFARFFSLSPRPPIFSQPSLMISCSIRFRHSLFLSSMNARCSHINHFSVCVRPWAQQFYAPAGHGVQDGLQPARPRKPSRVHHCRQCVLSLTVCFPQGRGRSNYLLED